MTSQWQPCREPLRVTILRTLLIALVVGAVLAHFGGGAVGWPLATLLVLWPTFGGHWVEIWFLNRLRPRLSDVTGDSRGFEVAARVGVWFIAGVAFAGAMGLTAKAVAGFRPKHWPVWWLAGLAFIGIELVAHLGLQMRGRPNFYNGRG